MLMNLNYFNAKCHRLIINKKAYGFIGFFVCEYGSFRKHYFIDLLLIKSSYKFSFYMKILSHYNLNYQSFFLLNTPSLINLYFMFIYVLFKVIFDNVMYYTQYIVCCILSWQKVKSLLC